MDVRFWRGLATLLLAVVAWSWSGTSRADGELKFEYADRIKAYQSVTPLGDSPFGEQLSLYNGELSFYQADVTLPGQGPNLVIGRSFKPKPLNHWRSATFGFADWQLEIPRIQTRSPVPSTNRFWRVEPMDVAQHPNGSGARCSQLSAAPLAVAAVSADNWWNGYQLVAADGSMQEVFRRDPANTLAPNGNAAGYPMVTARHWQISCLAQTANGVDGEGFLATAPDGTRYWFDWIVPGPSSEVYATELDVGIGKPRPITATITDATALVTRIEDRYGNYLTYSYDGSRLVGITASDGRVAQVSWLDDHRIGSIQAGRDAKRTWSYAYGSFVGRQSASIEYLASVTLPDGSAWQLNLNGLDDTYLVFNGGYPSCDLTLGSDLADDLVFSGSITHPSGLVGQFTVQGTRHGRSNVPYHCSQPTDGSVPVPATPADYYILSLTRRSQQGAGIDRTWTYAYSNVNASWDKDCTAGCDQTAWTAETAPDGTVKRYYYNNGWGAYEGKLLRVDENADGSGAKRTTTYSYAAPDAGPYPPKIGVTPIASYLNGNDLPQAVLAPQQDQVVLQEGNNYVRHVESYDAYGDPVVVSRYSDIAGQASKREQTDYYHDLGHWVLGKVAKVTNLGNQEAESQTDYDGLANPVRSYRFGVLQQSYAWDAQGNLASATDGNGNTTGYADYKAGIPQSIAYPDGTKASATVDDFGQITSVTDQAGATTQYGFDAIGRLTDIVYPADPDTAWLPRHYAYEFVGDDRGIAGAHWRRTLSQGGLREVVSYDASLRPVLEDRYIDGDDGSHSVVRHDYDWDGRSTFDSYATAGALDLGQVAQGIHVAYDALGREVQRSQDAESGALVTATSYLAGAGKQVTDPSGHATTRYYQVFDEPDYDAVISVAAPDGVTQAIDRDVYGEVTRIRQYGSYGGLSGDQSRYFAYDGGHRLCRYYDPESGSTVMDYDAAGNVAWKATGVGIDGEGSVCGREQVADAAKTLYAYDALNRTLQELPPTGTDAITYAYDAVGRLTDSTVGVAHRTLAYNQRGLLTQETHTVGDLSNATVRYGYDGYGHVASVTYPDGVLLSYTPDALGRPIQVQAVATVLARDIGYFADDSPQVYTLGNGVTRTLARNARQLPSRLSYVGAQGTYLDESYAYDANGNLTGLVDQVDHAHDTSLSYDELNRLVTAKAPQSWGEEAYTYDPLNNLRSRLVSGTSYTFGYDAGNRLSTVTAGTAQTAVGYDARGNRTRYGDASFTYNARNQLLGATGVASYDYDSDGHRVRKTLAGGTSDYALYSHEGKLLYAYDAATGRATDYVYLGDRLLARWVAGAPTYLLTDRLGSPAKEVDPSGATTLSVRYRPWGEQLEGQDETQPAFTGHVKDPETGLTYAQARYYRPGPGQFESVDPVLPEAGDVFGFNRYAYASDNPIISTDPDGRQVFGSPDEMMHPLTEEQARAALPSAISAVPVVGDVQNIVEAVNNPSISNITIAAIGTIPEIGGAAKQVAKEAVAVAKAGKTAEKLEKTVTLGKRSFSSADRNAGFEKAKDANGVARCEYCGAELTRDPGRPNSYEADHTIPYSRGGPSTPDNLTPSCRSCNRSKGYQTPDEWGGP